MRISTMMSSRSLASPLGGPIVLSGHLRKLKTLRKKYFVLRAEATGCPACLEYYDNKKKFKNNQPPKRSISLQNCFNINKRSDMKQQNVIALYTKDECFCIVLDNEKDMGEWLNAMLLLQNGGQPDGEQPRPTFEHVWQLTIQKKALGEQKNIHGPYRLCLSDATLTFVKVGTKDTSDFIEFPLVSIRRCGFKNRIFYMEMGRSAITGDGEFWMEAEDNNIAHNMYSAILTAMSSSNANRDEGDPRQGMRSSSANDEEEMSTCERERWDSLHSQARTTSEGHTTSTVLGPPNMYSRGMFSVILPNHVSCASLEKEFVLEDVCGSSPSYDGEAYVPMSSSTAHLHSRSSSLVDKTSTLTPDDYVFMTLAEDDGYAHMDPSNNQNDHFLDNISALDEDLQLDKSEHHIRNSNSCSTRP